MAFRDKDPNRLGSKGGAEKLWSNVRPLKKQGLVPPSQLAMTTNQPKPTSTSFLAAAIKGKEGNTIETSSVVLSPLGRRSQPYRLLSNDNAGGALVPTLQPDTASRAVPSLQPFLAPPGIPVTPTATPDEFSKRPLARALSFLSVYRNEEQCTRNDNASFDIYQDVKSIWEAPECQSPNVPRVVGLTDLWDSAPHFNPWSTGKNDKFLPASSSLANNIWADTSRRRQPMSPITSVSGDWKGGMEAALMNKDNFYNILQASHDSPSCSLDDEDESVDYEDAERMTEGVFRLLFGDDGIKEDSPLLPSTTEASHHDEAVKQVDVETKALANASVSSNGENMLAKMWNDIKDQYNIDDIIVYKGPMTRPDYANVIADLVAFKTVGGAERAEYVLLYIIRLYKLGLSNVRPDGGCYNKVLHGYAEARMPLQAEAIINLMCALADDGDEMAVPNTKHYTTLLHAWQRSKMPDSLDHCEQILDKMHELYEIRGLTSCKPDAFTYTTVLHGWSDSGRPDASARAEALFRKMKYRVEQGDEELAPDTITYSNLINVIANGQGYARAADILWEMVDEFLKGNAKCKPRVRNLNTILAVWSKSYAPYAPEQAHKIVLRWLHLNETTEMTVKPDAYSYCLLLKCWSTSTRSDGSERAEETLLWLKQRSRAGDCAAKLDTIKYSTVLTAWIVRKKWKQASALFEKMVNDYLAGNKDAKPDLSVFQKILDGLCSASLVKEADSLVRTMWTLSIRTGEDVTSNCAQVIKAWGQAGFPDRAECLLMDLQRLFDSHRIKCGPTKHLYRMAIDGWGRSKVHDRGTRIASLSRKMNLRFPAGAYQQIKSISNDNTSLTERQHS
ncbi:hypothetical protein MPSEU_000443400 [Mayamaea pseudoterrestris]|nr:hypothetical protein MPSEU_000443400 [Mayamaea pseudoterrestris]